jgi:hypothetical protein
MHKQRVMRTSLVAILGFLAFIAVPAVAQAHHIEATASCKLTGNQAVATLAVKFVGFTQESQPTVRGKVWLNGVAGSEKSWTNAAPPLTWNQTTGNATLTTSWNVDGGNSYLGKAQFTWTEPNGSKKTGNAEASTGTCPTPPQPAIQLDKTGAATAAAGSTFTYFFKATNTGNVTLTDVQLTDPKCQSTLTRVEPNLADTSFDKGDEWHYTCTVVAPAGPAQVDNVAKVCGDYDPPEGDPTTVCDDDPHTFTVPPGENPPGNPPGNPPSVTPDVVPPGTTPDGEVLPDSIVSGRAQLRGPSGCVKQAFRARVSGRSIASVTFFVDGRKVKQVGRGGAFALKVNPARYGLGRHKVVAVVRFTAESGTKARRLPLTFRRCAQGAVAPRFTG